MKTIVEFKKSDHMGVALFFENFKGKDYMHIREYFVNDAGEQQPTSRGISLQIEQSKIENSEEFVTFANAFAALGNLINNIKSGVKTPMKPATKPVDSNKKRQHGKK